MRDEMDEIFRENLQRVSDANRILAATRKDALISFARYDTALATLREWERQLEELLSSPSFRSPPTDPTGLTPAEKMTEIPNALTKEEWESSSIWRGPHMVCGANTGFDVRLNAGGGNPGRRYGEFPTSDLPAIMALANHALPDRDPRKLDKDDWWILNQLIGDAEESGQRPAIHYERAHAAVAKIHALLPPF